MLKPVFDTIPSELQTEKQIIQRKLFLKRQARAIIRQDITKLHEKLFLYRLKSRLEREISHGFDRNLSRRLDAVQVLLEEVS